MPRKPTKKTTKPNPKQSLVPPGHHCIHLVLAIPTATSKRRELALMQVVQRRIIKLGGRMLRISTSRFGFVAGAGVAAAEEIAGNQHIHVVYRRGVVGRKDKG